MSLRIPVTLLLLGIVGLANADGHKTAAVSATCPAGEEGSIDFKRVWSRALPAVAKNGAVYFSVQNTCAKSISFVNAQTPKAARCM